MAEIASLFLSLSLFFLLFSPVISRNISPKTTTTTTTTSILDVSASLSRTTQVLSHSYQELEEESASADLSLRLHSRDYLPRSNSTIPADYRSLTLSRLARDSARVAAISARVAFATSGIKNSDLTPQQYVIEESSEEESIQGPVISGSSQGSGEYFSRVGVGSPAQALYLVLDTGSDVSWVQCQPCADCYQQSDPIFDPSASSSYSPLDCYSDACRSLDVSSCRNATCLYQVSYGDGSYTVGDFATDTVTLGGSQPLRSVAFGCGHDNEGLFVGAAGLLGLGGGALSFPRQISAKSFSYCLVDRDSSSTSTLDFGDAAASVPSDAVSASLLRNNKVDTFYYVGMSGITVGGQLLSIPQSAFDMDAGGAGGVIVDSGTAVTRLQTEAYDALRDAFVSGTGGLPRAAGVALFDTCYDLSSRTSVEVPTVGLMFGEGKELRLPAKNYLIPVDSAGTFCLAFAPTSSQLSIIGNVQQQGTRVTFDLQNAMVGFENAKC
ncbi:putative protein ASPARTIC PROTEASE IN GUARD CELL 1 [Iris pallida]|uniref:Peptidase A1 domain-containing protein n=1 Tax=Iris pallida TaxID=29817 RepID=A0AAX6IC59_IRIPA|nr:putative protein ASPARTIC PROTEASE IN GUARD CELL 1 [Iris pallida]KAJ6850826.1 putative protein ASPARTIC PROTEASE IN GUARD CELL 1 [Iris pallida]